MEWLLVAGWYSPCLFAAGFFAMVAFRVLFTFGKGRDDRKIRK